MESKGDNADFFFVSINAKRLWNATHEVRNFSPSLEGLG